MTTTRGLAILRRFHDATEGFEMPTGHSDHLPANAIADVVCHWDAVPYNFIFVETRATGLIDFDEAGPGRRIDDLAYFAYRFAPLCSDANFADGGWSAGTDRFGRLARIFELYPDPNAHLLSDLLIARLDAMIASIRNRVHTGECESELLAHIDIYVEDQRFIGAHRDQIRAATSV